MNNEKKRHIRIDSDIDEQLLENVKKHKNNYTTEINSVLRIGLEYLHAIEILNEITIEVGRCFKKLHSIEMLQKQLYSDMEFPTVTNPNKSENLKKFYSNLRKDIYND